MANHVELFAHAPNWKQQVVESFEYQTEIITSQSGKEQRRAMRRESRVALEYQITPFGPEADALKRQLNYWGAHLFAVPNWARKTTAAPGAKAGADHIPTTAPIPGLRTGHQIAILTPGAPEVRTVTQQHMDRIEIDSPLIYDIDPGVEIYLLLSGFIPSGVQSTALTPRVSRMSVRFEAVPETIYFASAAPELPSHDGLEVIELQPNWQGGVDTTHAYEVYTVDYGIGRSKRYYPVAYTRPVVKWSFRNLDRKKSNAVIALFHRLKGRLRSCYVPSLANDLPVSKVTKGSTRLSVDGKDAYLYWDRSVDRALRIETMDGAVWYNRATDVREGDGTSEVLLATALPADATIRAVSWMRRCRLASDLLVVSWRSDTVSECDLSFSTLEDLR